MSSFIQLRCFTPLELFDVSSTFWPWQIIKTMTITMTTMMRLMQRYLRPAGRGSSMDEATLKREDAGVSNIVFLVTLVVMSKEAWLYCIEPFFTF